MLVELDKITSILSKFCVILIITLMVIKSWQFKKYISYYIKMTQPAVDQIDQLLLQAVASNSVDVQAGDAQLLVDDNTHTKMKEKLIQVVAGGKSRRYLGKTFSTNEIEQLDEEALRKLYARYEAALGGLITNKLKKNICVMLIHEQYVLFVQL